MADVRLQRHVERVLKYFDRRLPFVEVNRDDVKTARTAGQPMADHVLERHARHAKALPAVDRFRPGAEREILTRLDLHEHQRPGVAGNDVQFSTPPSIAARKNHVPAALQLATGEIFAGFSQIDPAARHAPTWQQTPSQIPTSFITKTRRPRRS